MNNKCNDVLMCFCFSIPCNPAQALILGLTLIIELSNLFVKYFLFQGTETLQVFHVLFCRSLVSEFYSYTNEAAFK